MEIILLENLENLGNFGNKKFVKNGYARNYLIPQEKAITFTEKTLQKFIVQKTTIQEKKNNEIITNLQKYETIVNKKIQFYEKSTKYGTLYGSIGKTQLMEKLNKIGVTIQKQNIMNMEEKIKKIGNYVIKFNINPGNITFKKTIYIIREK